VDGSVWVVSRNNEMKSYPLSPLPVKKFFTAFHVCWACKWVTVAIVCRSDADVINTHWRQKL